jgi:hypothetical protein
MVSGVLPLADAASQVTGAKTDPSAAALKALYLQGEFDVTEPGSVIISNTLPGGSTAWLNADPYDGDAAKRIALDLPVGHHKITLRVPISANSNSSSEAKSGVEVELTKPAHSTAEFQPLGGP